MKSIHEEKPSKSTNAMYHNTRIVWYFQKFTLTLFLLKFRENNNFTKEIAKYVGSWYDEKMSGENIFILLHHAIHTVEFTKFLCGLKIISWKQQFY